MAFHYYASFRGQKQGQLKGESTKSAHKDKWFELVAFKMGVESPIDQKGGKPTGARTHSPIKLTRETDSSSPLLFQMCCGKDLLTEVMLETRLNDRPTRRITLNDAIIASIGRSHQLPSGEHSSQHDTNQLEEIALTFQKISVENLAGSTSTSDDWTQPSK